MRCASRHRTGSFHEGPRKSARRKAGQESHRIGHERAGGLRQIWNHVTILERITKTRLVPVVVIDRADDAVPLAEALRAGGLDALEITLRTPEAEASIHRIR